MDPSKSASGPNTSRLQPAHEPSLRAVAHSSLSNGSQLHQYGKLRTSEIDHAQTVVAKVFEPHHLEPHGRGSLDARLNAVQVDNLTIGYLTYGRDVRIDLPNNDTWYHINVPLSGDSQVSRSDGMVEETKEKTSAAVFLPHKNQSIEWKTQTEQIGIRIPAETIETHLETMTNRRLSGPLDLDLLIDLTSPAGKSFQRAISFAISEWGQAGVLATTPSACRHVEEMILSSLLLSADGAHQQWINTAQNDDAEPSIASTAREYIHEHANEVPTLTDLLRAVGASARTLQTQFQKEYGYTPTEYLRDLRMRNARYDLLNSTIDDETVTDAAMRWGFYHLGRFASDYKHRFSELPSETLRRQQLS